MLIEPLLTIVSWEVDDAPVARLARGVRSSTCYVATTLDRGPQETRIGRGDPRRAKPWPASLARPLAMLVTSPT